MPFASEVAAWFARVAPADSARPFDERVWRKFRWWTYRQQVGRRGWLFDGSMMVTDDGAMWRAHTGIDRSAYGEYVVWQSSTVGLSPLKDTARFSLAALREMFRILGYERIDLWAVETAAAAAVTEHGQRDRPRCAVCGNLTTYCRC